MAMQRQPAGRPPQGGPPQQIVFKPKEQVLKFSKMFPMIYGGLGVVFLIALGIGLWTKFYLIPVFMAIPIFSAVAGGTFVKRLTQSRIVIDGERLRIVQGNQVQANLAWGQITKLTVRKENDNDIYEMWVKNQPIPLPAGFYHDGDKLLKAVSARTKLAWEAGRTPAVR
jgi:hypothetical protein